MTITVVDVETSFVTGENGKTDPSPFNSRNKLVSVGINNEYLFFNHDERQDNGAFIKVQNILDKTTLLIGHNLKFDLAWLYEVGFKYSGKVYDTMIGEYVLQRGVRKALSLKECCNRRKLSSKSDATQDFINQGISFEMMPSKIVEEYGRQDITVTRELYHSQVDDFKQAKNRNLVPTVKMMNSFLQVLTKMEMNGIQIDLDALHDVETKFKIEYDELREKIDTIIWERMGDTRINPASPEQLSWLIYGVKVVDKKKWAEAFNIGIDPQTKKQKKKPKLSRTQFTRMVAQMTQPIYKTRSHQCIHCSGQGRIQKIKVNGEPYKNLSPCHHCSGTGIIYEETKARAGFTLNPSFVSDVSEGGFKTDRVTLGKLTNTDDAELNEFIECITRYNALETYLNTFVEGIKSHCNKDGSLHPKFMQCVTATGRLSSRDPNFQNQPRGKTFPIRRVVTSRWEGGKILEMDFAQLEFRTAVFLSQDRQGMADIQNKVDIHQFTADVIGVSRQEAKGHTFKPLYGGMSGTESEKKYYKEFLVKYKDIAKWHDQLESDAINYKVVSLPSGREYAFPFARRMPWGSSSNSTQVKNYPVQGFATADIVPLTCIAVDNLMVQNKVKSLLINTIHDSVLIDVHPDEEDMIIDIVKKGARNVVPMMKEHYDIDFNVPLDTDVKVGYNWLEMREV
jgi:DNA polymerase I-like protein with 3'-5' exonuclease and polymerase domains